MPFAFGGVSTIGFDGAIQWTSATATEHGGDVESVIGRKLWDWSPRPEPIRRALADAMFDNRPQTYSVGWLPPGGGQLLTAKATAFPLPRGRMHDVVLLWADSYTGRALTRGEVRTLRAIADGLHQNEVARSMGVAQATVKTTLSRARHKLGARTLTHAVALALKRGLI